MNHGPTSLSTYTTGLLLCLMAVGLAGCPKVFIKTPPSSEQQNQAVPKKKLVKKQQEVVPKLREEVETKKQQEVVPKLREEVETKKQQEVVPKLREEVEAKKQQEVVPKLREEVEAKKQQEESHTSEEIAKAKQIGSYLIEIIELKLENDIDISTDTIIALKNSLVNPLDAALGVKLQEQINLRSLLEELQDYLKSPFENLVGIQESIDIYSALIADATETRNRMQEPHKTFYQKKITVYEKMKTCSELLLNKGQNWSEDAFPLAKKAAEDYAILMK